MASRIASNELNKKRRVERALNNDLRKIFFSEKNIYLKSLKENTGYDKFHNEARLEEAVDKHFKRIKSRVLRKTIYAKLAYDVYSEITKSKVIEDVIGSFNKLSDKEYKATENIIDYNTSMTNKIPQRTMLISNVETQPVYESAKLINAVDKDVDKTPAVTTGSAIAFGTLSSIYTGNKKKVWRSILSSSTRDAHASADGQTVNIGDYFIVNGQQLMYPGDSKYATPDNFMNCYCSVEYK